MRGSVLEKEAYAVMATLDRMHWIAATADGFDHISDRKNLTFLFDALSIVPDLPQTSLQKVLLRLSMYTYTCVHINEIDHVWAYLLEGWSASKTKRSLITIPTLPSFSASVFEWPAHECILEA